MLLKNKICILLPIGDDLHERCHCSAIASEVSRAFLTHIETGNDL